MPWKFLSDFIWLLLIVYAIGVSSSSKEDHWRWIRYFITFSCRNETFHIRSIAQAGLSNVSSYETAFMTPEAFMSHKKGIITLDTGAEELIPNCICFWTDENSWSTHVALWMQKISSDLRALTHLKRKPTILLILNDNQGSSYQQRLIEIFNMTRFRMDTNVFAIFRGQGQSVGVSPLWQIYNIKSLLVIQEVTESQISPSPVTRRGDFQGEVITATIRTEQPDWMLYVGKKDNITLLGGFSVLLYWDFQTILNFTTHAIIGDGLKTLENNTLGGKTFNQLYGDEADISLSQSSVVPFRAKYLTFLQPTYYGIIHCFFQQPSANSIRNIVTAPFDQFVWVTLIGTWLLLILLVKIGWSLKKRLRNINYTQTEISTATDKLHFDKHYDNYWIWSDFGKRSTLELHRNQSNSYSTTIGVMTMEPLSAEDDDDDGDFAKEVGMWAFAANCQKSWHKIPSSLGMKMMFFVGILCGVLTYVGYSGAIVSTLTVRILPVKSVADLVHFNFKFTVHEWSEPFQSFLQLMIENQNLKQKVLKISTKEEISHLLDASKPRGFFTYSDLFYPAALQLNYSEIFICSHISKVQVSPVFYKSAMFLRKGSQFVEFFNHKIIIIRERGLNHRYVTKYETRNIFPCGGNDVSGTVDPIQISDVFTAFLVILTGLASSFILLAGEITVGKLTFYTYCKKKS